MQGLTSNSGVKAFFMIPARLANAVKVNSRVVLRIHKIEKKAYMPKGLFIWRLSHVLVLAAHVIPRKYGGEKRLLAGCNRLSPRIPVQTGHAFHAGCWIGWIAASLRSSQ